MLEVCKAPRATRPEKVISTFREFSKRGSVGVKALDRRLVEHWTLNRRKDWNHWNGWTGRSGLRVRRAE
jgi:hypothetical protein